MTEQHGFYSKHRSTEEVRRWQLDKFNEQWERIGRTVPYFARQLRSGSTPVRFSSWEEVRQLVPVMDRQTIQTHAAALRSTTRPPDVWRSTGGSTGEPLIIPVWRSETLVASADQWHARSWFGVDPADRLFLVWGHSHLLGNGLAGWWSGQQRRLRDVLLGYTRWSAYDLSDRRLREAGDAVLASKPAYILGYAAALDRLARVNAFRKDMFRALSLKVVIATAERFPTEDSRTIISDVFGCRVAMEYGAVETGPIAQETPDGDYAVMWRHYFVEAQESRASEGAWVILITSLFNRCLPLVRYRIGDLVSAACPPERIGQRFDRVIGRLNDSLVLSDGTAVHSEAFSHAVKEVTPIAAFQVIQTANGEIRLVYEAPRPLTPDELGEFRRRLGKINQAIARIEIQRASVLERTVAGKLRCVRRDLGPFSAQAASELTASASGTKDVL